MPSPFIDKVLAKYPGVDLATLVFPPEADDWDEQGAELFIGSGGFLKPKKKKSPASAADSAAVIAAVGATAAAGSTSSVVDATICDAAPALLVPLAKSDWWVNNPSSTARVRLFCAMGIGSVASTYGPWVSKATAEAYPEVEVCVVEFPGHGTNFGEPLASLEAAAEGLEAEIRRCHCGGAGGGGPPPLALFGFSMGANVMYRVAQRLGGCCRRLYLAGRAPPHLAAPVRELQAPAVARLEELLGRSDVEGVAAALLQDLLPLFMAPPQLKTYGRLMEARLTREDGRAEVLRMARSLAMDCRIGMDANEGPRGFAGGLRFYHSRADATWPPVVPGLYEDLPGLWGAYTTGPFSAEEVAPVSHDELGGVGSPIFPLVCQDVAPLAREEGGSQEGAPNGQPPNCPAQGSVGRGSAGAAVSPSPSPRVPRPPRGPP